MGDFLLFDAIGKAFGDKVVLEGISLGLDRGECVALLGESGCGKTSLLNITAGFLKADRGTLTCDGRVLDGPGTQVPTRRRGFAMVFQDFSLWPHMTLGENVAFGLRLRGMNRAEREKRAEEALARVGLQGRGGEYPAQLSGGQQQRVAIARAIVVEPRLLLLDEPLSALDARLREDLRDEIARIIQTLEVTALYVTHDQTEALTVAHRVAVMRGGRIEQVDTPEEIYARPKTAYVAEFLGGANLLEEGRRMIRREQVRIVIGSPREISLLPGEESIPGVCLISRYVGGQFEVFLETESGRVLRGFHPHLIEPGRRASACFSKAACHSL